jgi:hypothetical protein
MRAEGCTYRSRFLFAAGWGLAALFLLAAVAIAIQSGRLQDALVKENTILSEQVNAQLELRAIQSPRPVVPDKEPVEASAPPPPPRPATPKPRKRAAQRDSTSTRLRPVPDSDKWWNRP